MQYRPYGKLGFNASVFGMGLMRLPQEKRADGTTGIDHAEAIKMIRYAIDNGVNYLDTAYVYQNGESEIVAGEALQDGYRDKVKIATKLPVWLAENEDDARRMLNEELERLQTDKIDVYLLHSINRPYWKKIKELGMYDWMQKFKAEGLIDAIAFSYHDDYDTFVEMLDTYEWDMAQIQMNYLDVDFQATLKGMRYAYDKGIPVVIMEPLRGGNLVNVPAEIQAMYDAFPIKRSPVEWAFRFMYNFEEPVSILSGVSDMEQLKQNIAIFSEAEAGAMSAEEQQLMANVREAYRAKMKVPCTACEYCMPCPSGVNIPKVFSQYNSSSMFDDAKSARESYARLKGNGGAADNCVECGACEEHCPQNIAIIEELKNAMQVLG